MANNLPAEKQAAIIGSLCEGSRIRSIERMTSVHRDTIMRLGVRVGQCSKALMNERMRNLNCTRLEMDEIWGFVGKKAKHVRASDDPKRTGDVCMTHIQELRDVIHHLHGAKAEHLESFPVTEKVNGHTVWDGVVEVFLLTGHPKTDRVYAWIHETDDPVKPKRHVTVLHIPPVVSPRTAVQAVIVKELRDRAKTN